jgi:hypothetical protein
VYAPKYTGATHVGNCFESGLLLVVDPVVLVHLDPVRREDGAEWEDESSPLGLPAECSHSAHPAAGGARERAVSGPVSVPVSDFEPGRCSADSVSGNSYVQ